MSDETQETATQPITCMKKKRFDNEDRAWSAIFNMRARGQDTEMLTPYACAQCGLWHLGRLPSRLSPLGACRAGVRT